MKRSNECTKCGSKRLLRIPGVPGEGPHIVIGERVMHPVLVSKFVCSECGFIEEWVDREEDLEHLKEQYGAQ